MVKVLKYQLANEERQVFEIRSNEILSIKEQHNKMVMYALVNPDSPVRKYEVVTVPTGVEVEGLVQYTFLDTVKLFDGSIMFHIFYRKL